MVVSLVMTVLDEAGSLPALLDSILAQERRPDEVVIVDGGSSDRTVALARDFARRAAPDLPVRVEVLPGANISAGRNRAIELAQGDIIVVTDGGVVLHAAWLARLVAALEAGADVAAGFFVPAPQSSFELAMGATVLPAVEDVAPATFLPSSRSVAFRRAAWGQAGRYPEWLDYCEDVVFDLALRREGVRQRFVPAARVAFRPRPSLPAFFRQYYRYARGDGKADLWRRRHTIRYGVYLGAPLGWLLGPHWPVLRWLIVIAMLAYVRRPYRRLWALAAQSHGGTLGRFLRAAAWVPLIRLTGDVAKMVGYPVGVWWRLTARHRQHSE
ncbi:MAG: glycosyltransferase [Chloroflexota bacterium]|nr:glycosyltransferase [Chloroflexota bacterium]